MTAVLECEQPATMQEQDRKAGRDEVWCLRPMRSVFMNDVKLFFFFISLGYPSFEMSFSDWTGVELCVLFYSHLSYLLSALLACNYLEKFQKLLEGEHIALGFLDKSYALEDGPVEGIFK